MCVCVCVCVFWCKLKDSSQQHTQMPQPHISRAVLLNCTTWEHSSPVRLAVLEDCLGGGSYSCVHCESHEQSKHVQNFIGSNYSLTVRALVLLALASFPAHSY